MKNTIISFLTAIGTTGIGWGIFFTILAIVFAALAFYAFTTKASEAESPQSVNMAEAPPVHQWDDSTLSLLRRAEESANPWNFLQINWAEKQPLDEKLLDILKSRGVMFECENPEIILQRREYHDPNSITMEVMQSGEIVQQNGHDPGSLYIVSRCDNGTESAWRLICLNGLMEELILPGSVDNFVLPERVVVQEGDCLICITGMTPEEAMRFAEKHELLGFSYAPEGGYQSAVGSSVALVYQGYKDKPGSIFDVRLYPGDVLLREGDDWVYIKEPEVVLE